MKSFLGDITEHYDGYEFSSPVIIEASCQEDAQKKINELAKSSRDQNIFFVKGLITQEIPNEDALVLKKYL